MGPSDVSWREGGEINYGIFANPCYFYPCRAPCCYLWRTTVYIFLKRFFCRLVAAALTDSTATRIIFSLSLFFFASRLLLFRYLPPSLLGPLFTMGCVWFSRLFESTWRDYSPRINNNNFGDKTPRKVNTHRHTQVREWNAKNSYVFICKRCRTCSLSARCCCESKHPKTIYLAMFNKNLFGN